MGEFWITCGGKLCGNHLSLLLSSSGPCRWRPAPNRRRVRREIKVRPGLKEPKAIKVRRGHRAQRAIRGFQVRRGLKGQRETQGQPGLREPKAIKAFLARKARKVRKETKARPAHRDNKARRAKRAQAVQKERQALQARPDPKETKAKRAHRARREKRVLPGLKVLRAQRVRRLQQAEVIPRLSRIAIFGIPNLNASQFAAMETATRAFQIEAELMDVRVPDDFERALEAARTRHVRAGILLWSPLVFTSSKLIGELALAKRLHLVSLFAEFPTNGGLVAYGPNLSEMFRRCGEYVGKVLHGAKPSDLPIQRPERFDLVINLKTAVALGIDMPTQLQQLADEVIE